MTRPAWLVGNGRRHSASVSPVAEAKGGVVLIRRTWTLRSGGEQPAKRPRKRCFGSALVCSARTVAWSVGGMNLDLLANSASRQRHDFANRLMRRSRALTAASRRV